ncbi:GalNAc(5)-diNAcBac-PP-undecaprenol beta-1,3-glucosyltransferase [Caulifigura coniformis]|uniref:GalNAc(5)-diNAcBac-PP-undecaprenol beta-1,3-glucosyltransferase n=1 Tax=Caulifigura coniformis TaxID=2527983 RepID=A0A517SM67_9PLAN|nr:glycosyltransferase family 2 protein [Caulifigura coniformis]QDT57198.1 GalNAc(5)-diNAcBac-PP-undecaprenol beta-1,3-glucosyltransferase [Caulifigura coniformis]
MPVLDSTSNLERPADRETLVSVVVPTFNRAELLRSALRSVQAQSWTDLEVVVVDDGSTDETQSVVASMSAADNRIRYLRQPNGGVSAARNTALANCRGAMIAFLDSDDAWHPTKLATQVEVLRALPAVGMVWSDMNAVDVQGRIVHCNYLQRMYKGYRRLAQGQLFPESAPLQDVVPQIDPALAGVKLSWGPIYSHMLYGNLVHTSTVVLRRERAAAVGLFDESMKAGGEDYKFHLATTRLGAVAFLDQATIDYRIGGADQITNLKNQVHFATAFLKTLEEQIAHHRPELQLTDRELDRIRAEAHDWLAAALIEGGQRRLAAAHALKAIRQRPATRNSWKTLAKTMLPRTAVELVRAARRLRSDASVASM